MFLKSRILLVIITSEASLQNSRSDLVIRHGMCEASPPRQLNGGSDRDGTLSWAVRQPNADDAHCIVIRLM